MDADFWCGWRGKGATACLGEAADEACEKSGRRLMRQMLRCDYSLRLRRVDLEQLELAIFRSLERVPGRGPE